MIKTKEALVPDIQNPSPDYYCTWQAQLYATCDGKQRRQRETIGEKALFNKEKPYGWAYFYEKSRRDLFLVMDDSWDVPKEDDGTYYGSLILSEEKFPEAVKNSKTNAEALKRLTDRVKALGWKGLGGWVCAQVCEQFRNGMSDEEYLRTRVLDANEADFAYWKVDWGQKSGDAAFRKMQTDLAAELAPGLTVEHGVIFDALPFCSVFRTYDVPAVMSIPATLQKIGHIAGLSEKMGSFGMLNCEDEAYIAAAGGFTMGIMRHPYSGAFVNGKPDMSFPEVGRNLKTKMYEVLRAVRWHRIAPAFAVSADIAVSEDTLRDYWQLENVDAEIEAWWLNNDFFDPPIIEIDEESNTVAKTAPAQLARNCDFAKLAPDENGDIPYVISAKNPTGAFSVATLGRAVGRSYKIPLCDVTVDTGDASTIGVFGEYKTLHIKTELAPKKLLIQDIAADFAYDITDEVCIDEHGIMIPGELIRKIGTSEQPENDTSEPGALIKIVM